MDRPTATHGKAHHKAHRAAGACVRIGYGGASAGNGNCRAFWLTAAEAKLLRAELDAAIRKADGLAITGLPPRPPEANAAALEAA